MSMNEFKEVLKDEAIKQEYTAFIEEKKPETLDAFADTMVYFAASKGFSISKEDVLNSIPDESKSGKVELSDDMLDAVAGGRCFQDWVKDIAYDFVKSLEDSGWL